MKTRYFELSNGVVAKVNYTIETGFIISRMSSIDGLKQEVVIYSSEENKFTKGLTLGDKNSTLLPDLQLFINSQEVPIVGKASISSIEFLQSEYHMDSFILKGTDLNNLILEIEKLKQPTEYTKAEDFYNDLIGLK